MPRAVQRVFGAILLLVAGVFSLPLAAALLDQGDENWIVVTQVVAMGAVGALLALCLPGLAGTGVSPARRALRGVWWGLVAALVGALTFWFLLNGVGGA